MDIVMVYPCAPCYFISPYEKNGHMGFMVSRLSHKNSLPPLYNCIPSGIDTVLSPAAKACVTGVTADSFPLVSYLANTTV